MKLTSNELCYYRIIKSPVGLITLIANKKKLLGLSWGKTISKIKLLKKSKKHPILDKAERQLNEYFAGKRTSFNIPVAPNGTEFQKKVWKQLLKIPFGKNLSYSEQAKLIGKPKAARAVGRANGKNPIFLIIPCHRVISATGQLGGFAGGIATKKILLTLERINPKPSIKISKHRILAVAAV